MKKKVISSILACTMLFSVLLSGCSSTPAPVVSEEVAPEIGTEAVPDMNAQETTQSTEASAEASTEEAGESEDEFKGGGGIPWIDSEIKENVTADTPTDPKDDFHLYANKDWILSSEIPAGYSSWSHYAERALEVKKQCIDLLKDDSLSGHDVDLVQYYNSLLLDWDTRNELGYSEIKPLYDKLYQAASLDDITALITGKDTINEYYNFVSYGAETGLNDPEKYLVGVSSPGLILRDAAEYSERTELGDLYYGYNKDLFLFAAGKMGMDQAEAEKIFEDSIALETKMAKKIYTTKDTHSDDYFDKINNEMSFKDLTALCSVFPLKDILTNSGYKYNGVYLVTNPDYLKLLDEIYTEDNFELIKNRMILSYLFSYIGSLDKETYDKMNELQATYFGVTGTIPDDEMAYNKINGILTTSMQKVYIQKYGSEEDRQKMTDLCQEVIDTYRELLSENEWASDEVKNYAIEKLDKITIHAAYPDKFQDTSKLDISGCSLIEAVNKITLNNIEYNKSLPGKKVDKEMWASFMSILDCNAYYNPQDNTINMIIGMMGDPFYSSDMPVEELYASIGAFWVGHEISHAFDNNGSQFDAEGLYRDWWTEADKEEFNKRVKKMDDYLDTIVAFDGQHFIGSNIDTEMVADMTGLQCALRMASKVENFDYDKFFIKYAQMNGSLGLYANELSMLTQNEHPLDYSRTNVPVQQFQEFYDTYDVKEGDNMYLAPEDRLVIW